MVSHRIAWAVEKILLLYYGCGCLYGMLTFGCRRITRTPGRIVLPLSLPSTATTPATAQRIFVVFQRKWFIWFCVVLRCGIVSFYYYGTFIWWYTDDWFFNWLILIATSIMVCCSLGIVTLQLSLSGRFVAVTNGFLRLFRRTRQFAPRHSGMGALQLWLLSLKLLCLGYEILSGLLHYLNSGDFNVFIMLLCHTYLEVGIRSMLHIACVGYLSIGALHAHLNNFMLHEFQPHIKRLDSVLKRNFNYRSRRYTRKLTRFIGQLDECTGIYADIHRVGHEFHRLLQVHLLYALLFSYSGLTMVLYELMYGFQMWHQFYVDSSIYALKVLVDMLVLTLAAHSAVHNAEVTKKLSLDSVYMRGDDAWDRSMHLFLNRLNLYEFKPSLLGLFDVSNDMLLMFLSGIVTFLTYILQNSLKSQQ